MIVNCPVIEHDGKFTCPWCGETHNVTFKKNCPVYSIVQVRHQQGLGDTVTVLLARCGVSKVEGCDCQWRQQFLNALFPYRPLLWQRWLWKAGAFALFPLLILVAVACSLYQKSVGQWDYERKLASQQQELWRRARESKGG